MGAGPRNEEAKVRVALLKLINLHNITHLHRINILISMAAEFMTNIYVLFVGQNAEGDFSVGESGVSDHLMEHFLCDTELFGIRRINYKEDAIHVGIVK